jgi:hypothetical protein
MAEKFDIDGLVKQARVLCDEEESTINPDLQRIVGDPDDARISTFAQMEPNPQDMQLPNPLSPIEGDWAFFAYALPGAAFQARDGSEWTILSYDYMGEMEIENRWYPAIHPRVNLSDIRRSIYQWIEPVTQVVPPPPPGVDYNVQPVRIMDKEFGAPDRLSTGNTKSYIPSGW